MMVLPMSNSFIFGGFFFVLFLEFYIFKYISPRQFCSCSLAFLCDAKFAHEPSSSFVPSPNYFWFMVVCFVFIVILLVFFYSSK